MTDLVKFQIPAQYVLDHTHPTLAELVYGYRHGWLTAADTVAIAMSRLEENRTTQPLEEELALLRPAELDQVSGLVSLLEQAIAPLDTSESLWLFLAIAWLWDHRGALADPLGIVEMIYADFGYPAEIASLVRYMPPPSGAAPAGIPEIHGRWRRYVEEQTRRYRDRRPD